MSLALPAAGGLRERLGIRIDSGDLAELAVTTRQLLDQAGLEQVRIFASGGLDEHAIADLAARRAPIDAYGVGTKVGVSADAPYLDTAYKLVAYAGRPVMKLSPGKITAPGPKQVFRGPLSEGDIVGVRDEPVPTGHEPLLMPVMLGGSRPAPTQTWPLPRRASRMISAACPRPRGPSRTPDRRPCA
jgi:nicotinate phosphoribosyltransferase